MKPFVPYLPSMAELLDLEEIDRDLHRGINEVPDNGRPTLFGGQVAAQALMHQAEGTLGAMITQESLLRTVT